MAVRPTVVIAVLGFCLAGLGACSGEASRASNPAVQACEKEAGKQGFTVIDQQSVTPGEEGRYRIVFAATDKQGGARVICDFDPASGARIQGR